MAADRLYITRKTLGPDQCGEACQLDRSLPVRGDRDGTLVVEDGGVLLTEARPAKAAEPWPRPGPPSRRWPRRPR